MTIAALEPFSSAIVYLCHCLNRILLHHSRYFLYRVHLLCMRTYDVRVPIWPLIAAKAAELPYPSASHIVYHMKRVCVLGGVP